MSRKRNYRARRAKAEMNVVPYIDVMLVLLVIFMIAAPLIHQAIEIDLPKAPADNLDTKDDDGDLIPPIILTVNRQGQYFLNYANDETQALSPRNISAITRSTLEAHPKLSVIVRGDEGATYSTIIQGISYLQQGGAENVGLLTEPPEDAPK